MDPSMDRVSVAEEVRLEEVDVRREPPVELSQTLDEYAAEQFMFSVEAVEPELVA